MKNKDKKFKKILSYAYRLLSYRPRSKKELEFRLTLKKFEEEYIKEVLEYLEDLDYVNDKKFAKFWIQTRLTSRPCGISLLYYELKKKGLDEGLINSVIEQETVEYDEKQTALDLARERKQKVKGKDFNAARRSVFNFLKRRGFSYSYIYDAINEIFAE